MDDGGQIQANGVEVVDHLEIIPARNHAVNGGGAVHFDIDVGAW